MTAHPDSTADGQYVAYVRARAPHVEAIIRDLGAAVRDLRDWRARYLIEHVPPGLPEESADRIARVSVTLEGVIARALSSAGLGDMVAATIYQAAAFDDDAAYAISAAAMDLAHIVEVEIPRAQSAD